MAALAIGYIFALLFLSSECSKGDQSVLPRIQQECGPMPNVMAALPSIGDALCSR